MHRLWLIFAQTVTVAVAILFVVMTLKPEWLPHQRTEFTLQEVPATTDDGKRADLDVLPDLRIRRDERSRMDASAHRSRTIAPMSASHTISPSTRAMPWILHIRPRR